MNDPQPGTPVPAEAQRPTRFLASLTGSFRYLPTIDGNAIDPATRAVSIRRVILAWCFGSIFVQGIGSAPLVGMFRGLGASPFIIGLLAAIPALTMIVQPVSSYIVMRTGSRKRLFLWAAYPGRLVWIPIVLLGAYLPANNTTIALMLALVLLSRLSTELTIPAWFSWISELVPENRKGEFWGLRMMWGTIFGTASALYLGYYLGDSPPFSKFVVFFCVIAVLGWLDIFVHRGVVGVRMEPTPASVRLSSLISRPLRDLSFRPILIFTVCFSFATQLGGSMFFLLLLEEIKLSYLQISLYVAGLLGLFTILSSRLWGRLIDNLREGERLVFAASAAIVALVALPWTMMQAGQHIPIAVTIAVSGIGWGGLQVAVVSLLTAYSPAKERAVYVAVHASAAGLGNMIGALTAGTLASLLAGHSYQLGPIVLTPLRVVYAISAAARFSCLFLLPMIRQPDSRPISAYVRRMMSLNPFDRETWIYVRHRLKNQDGSPH